MERQFIKYENYKAHREKYGHIATWALWDQKVGQLNGKDLDRDYSIRKNVIIANSSTEYEQKGLDRLLNGDVVLLALNISKPKKSTKYPNEYIDILNECGSKEDSVERENKLLDLSKRDEKYLFYNMYSHAGNGINGVSGYGKGFMNSKFLHGAYMTDFVKFVEDDGKIVAAGIPGSSTSEWVLEALSKDKVDIQIEGLKEELDTLGIRPKVIVLGHSYIQKKYIKEKIKEILGYNLEFVNLYNYACRFIPLKDLEDMIEKVDKDIGNKIKDIS